MKTCIQANEEKRIIAKNVLFSFSCGKNRYLVLRTLDPDKCECIKASWNCLQGWRHVFGDVDQSIIKIVNRICYLSDNIPEKYPLSGESYATKASCTENNRIQLKIEQKKSETKFGVRTIIPTLFRLLISLLCSIVMLLILNDTCVGWLSYVFPKLESSVVKNSVVAFEFIVSLTLFLLFSSQRSLTWLYFNSVFPLGAIILIGVLKRWSWLGFLMPVALFISYLIVVVFNCIFNDEKEKRGKIEETCIDIKNTLVVVISICILATSIFAIEPYTYQSSEVTTSDVSNDELREQFIKACWEIEDNNFQNKNAEEKLEVLQQICDYECLYTFGCEPARVCSAVIDDEETLGHYNSGTQTITIDIDHLRDGMTSAVVDTLLHEIRHHWQHKIVDMYIVVEAHLTLEQLNMSPFREAKAFLENYDDYQNSDTDGYDAYYAQAVECDAREWASERIGWYDSFIDGSR